MQLSLTMADEAESNMAYGELLYFFARIRTPGRPSSRNSIPAFSSHDTILLRVSVRAPTASSNPSILRIVLSATFDLLESSF